LQDQARDDIVKNITIKMLCPANCLGGYHQGESNET
jgi:hypothetical protein